MQIVVNSTNEELEHPDAVILDYQRCMDWFDRAMNNNEYELYDDTLDFAKVVFDDIDINKDNWRTMGNGVSHVLSRIELTLALTEEPNPKKVVWRLPESGIFPKYHGNIVHLMIAMGFFGDDPSVPNGGVA
jgi:hypothetical protein